MNHNINHTMPTSHLHSASPSTQIVDQQGDDYKKPRERYNKKISEEQEITFLMEKNSNLKKGISLLEAEVLKLREKLSEIEKENEALKRANRISSNSHGLSQQSLEVVADPPFPKE